MYNKFYPFLTTVGHHEPEFTLTDFSLVSFLSEVSARPQGIHLDGSWDHVAESSSPWYETWFQKGIMVVNSGIEWMIVVYSGI